MPVTYNLIASNTLTSSAASVTFSAIPNTYTDLVLRLSGRSDSAGSKDLLLEFNGSSSALGSYVSVYGNGSTAQSLISSGQIFVRVGDIPPNTFTSNSFSSAEIYLPSYTVAANKPLSSFSATENNATQARIDAYAGLWSSTTAITQLRVYLNTGNFVSGSSFFLYGILSTP